MAISTHDFLRALFEHAELGVYFSSLPNVKDDPAQRGEKHVLTRDMGAVDKFVARWDVDGRGLFFCVSTIVGTRKKDNAREIIGLHMDADYRTIVETPTQIDLAIGAQRCQPTALVRSGHGKHGYWLFNEPMPVQGNIERVEAAMRQLADLFAGDMAVCEVSRLMRLPGTHNSKGGDWLEVEAEHINGPRYELDDLEEWLSETAPVLRRAFATAQPATANADPGNPFLMAAQAMGYKPPIDVEARLAAMTYGGAGDSSIHSTQLSVSASLCNAGLSEDEIVDALLAVTRRAAGDMGSRWNWQKEERNLRNMCRTWVNKHQLELERTPVEKPVDSSVDNVVDLGAARAKRKPPQMREGKPKKHIVVAEAALAALEGRGEGLLFTRRGGYRYADRIWTLKPDRTMKAELEALLEESCAALSMQSTNSIVNEARQYIMRQPYLWNPEPPFDQHGKVPTREGLVDPISGALEPCKPEHYCTWQVAANYFELAACPRWIAMLEEVFADRTELERAANITLLQEMAGVGLIDARPKALSCALILQGGSNYGKSGLLDVLGGLFGHEQNTTPLDKLDGTHALIPFVERVPWVLHEAFNQSQWHMSSTVKALVSGDGVQVNMKGGSIFTHKFTAPIFWGTNNPPQFKEATKAITNRIAVVECRREFNPERPVGVAIEARKRGFKDPSQLVLHEEMGGVLQWALAGLRRAMKRGYFVLPQESRAAADDIQRETNIVTGFVEDCCAFDPGMMVGTADFHAAFTSWWLEHKGEDRGSPSGDRIGKAMRSLGDQRIAVDRTDMRDKVRRYYGGIRLTEEGHKHWHAAVLSEAWAFQGKKASTSSGTDNPNRLIPADWFGRTAVTRMRKAQNDRAPGVTDTTREGSPRRSPTQASEGTDDVPF